MSPSQLRLACGLLVGIFLVPSAAMPHEVGTPVVVITDDVEIKVGKHVVERVGRGFSATVLRVQTGWLWVASDRVGWIRAESTLPRERALEMFAAQIKANPRDAGAWHARGLIHLALGAFAEANRDLDQAVLLQPSRTDYLGNRGRARLAADRVAEAIADFHRAVEQDRSARNFTNRGIAFRAEGLDDEALHDFDEAIRRAPETVHALIHRGEIYVDRGMFAAAIGDLTRAVTLQPWNVTAVNDLAWIYATCPAAEFRNTNEALRLSRSACALTEWSNPGCLDTLAAALAANGSFAEAIERVKQAVRLETSESRRAEFHRRLKLYERQQPYVEQIDSGAE